MSRRNGNNYGCVQYTVAPVFKQLSSSNQFEVGADERVHEEIETSVYIFLRRNEIERQYQKSRFKYINLYDVMETLPHNPVLGEGIRVSQE